MPLNPTLFIFTTSTWTSSLYKSCLTRMHGLNSTSTLLLGIHSALSLFQLLISPTQMPFNLLAMHAKLGVCSKSPTMASLTNFSMTWRVWVEVSSLYLSKRSSKRLDLLRVFLAMAWLGFLPFSQSSCGPKGSQLSALLKTIFVNFGP